MVNMINSKTVFTAFLFGSSALALPAPLKSALDSASALLSRSVTRPYGPYDDNGVVLTTGTAYKTWYQAGTTNGSTTAFTSYQCYSGNPDAKYPTSASEWLNFDDLWTINEVAIKENESDETILAGFKNAILQASNETNVDARLILAMAMQESTGNIHVSPSSSGNCGLLQAPTPCSSYSTLLTSGFSSSDAIYTMLMEGLQGTDYPGLAQALNSGSWKADLYPGNPYAAARIYNSGSIADAATSAHGILDVSVVTGDVPAYANDVANRLMGWDGGVAGCKISANDCGLRSVSECV